MHDEDIKSLAKVRIERAYFRSVLIPLRKHSLFVI